MAGISKHYLFSDGNQLYLDYQIPLRMLAALPQYAESRAGSQLEGTRYLQRMMESVYAEAKPKGWRKQIKALWSLRPRSSQGQVALTEYRVRPKRHYKQCPFRSLARQIRKFKPRKFTKASPFRGDVFPPPAEMPLPPADPIHNRLGFRVNINVQNLPHQFDHPLPIEEIPRAEERAWNVVPFPGEEFRG